jgi:hypothetical protein
VFIVEPNWDPLARRVDLIGLSLVSTVPFVGRTWFVIHSIELFSKRCDDGFSRASNRSHVFLRVVRSNVLDPRGFECRNGFRIGVLLREEAFEDKPYVGRAFGQSTHEVRIPFRSEGDVDPDLISFLSQ